MKINVLVISDDPANTSGFAKVVRELFKPFENSDKVEVKAMALYADPSTAPREVTIIKPSLGDEYGATSFLSYKKNNRVDMVFLLGDWWYWKNTFFNKAWKIANSVSQQIWYYAPLDGEIVDPEMAQCYLNADKVIAMSPFGESEIKKLGITPVLIPHGVDINTFHHSKLVSDSTRPFTFGVVSRNSRRKNIGIIMEAYATLSKELNKNERNIQLFIHTPVNDTIGGNLRAFAKYLDIEDEVEFTEGQKVEFPNITGYKDSDMVHEVYNQIDCIVSAGREGFGLPYIEAAALGIPQVLPDYSAHASMGYSQSLLYPILGKKLDPSGVLDIIISPKDVASAMLHQYKTYRNTDRVSPFMASLSWASMSKKLHKLIISEIDLEKKVLSNYALFEECYGKGKPVKIQKGHALVVLPQSHGDVLLITATINKLQKKFDHITLATKAQYFELLEGCPWCSLVEYDPLLHENYYLLHRYYDAVFTPHFETQRNANWVHGNHGRSLAEVYANNCGVELGEYWLPSKPKIIDEPYITIHGGSGKGEQTARHYKHWDKVVSLLEGIGHKIVQIGTVDDLPIAGTVDMRGKCSIAETNYLLSKARRHVGIDSYPMHAASILGTTSIIIWGNTFPEATGPEKRLKYNMIPITPIKRSDECPRPCHTVACIHCNDALNSIMPEYIASTISYALDS